MFLKRVAVLILAGLVMTASLAACDEEETSGKDDSENVGAEADDEEKEGKEEKEEKEEKDLLDEESIDNDPVGAAAASVSEIIGNAFDSEKIAGSKLLSSDKVHMTLNVESYDLTFDMESWSDIKNGKAAASIDIPHLTDLNAYIKNDEIVFESDKILGGKAYGTKLNGIDKRIKTAEIWETLGTSYEDVLSESGEENAEIIEKILEYFGNFEGFNEKYAEKILDFEKDFVNDVMDVLNKADHSVKSETVELSDGEVNALVLTYNVDSKLVGDFADVVVAGIEDYYDLIYGDLIDLASEYYDDPNMMEYIPEYVEDEFESAIEDLSFDFYINKKTGELVKIEANIEFPYSEPASIVVDLGKNPSESKEYNVKITVEDTDEWIEIVYTRENEADSFYRTAELIYHTDDDYEVIGGIDFSCENDDGTYTVALSVESEGYDIFEAELYLDASGEYDLTLYQYGMQITNVAGEYKYTGDSFMLSIDEIGGSDDVMIKFALDTEDCPELPKYIELLDMDAEQFLELQTAIMSFSSVLSDSGI